VDDQFTAGPLNIYLHHDEYRAMSYSIKRVEKTSLLNFLKKTI